VPSFTTDGLHYFISYISGPSHILLGIALADEPAPLIQMVERPPVGTCSHGAIDPGAVRKAVMAGVQEFGAGLYPTTIVYVANDSPRYALYQHCAKLIAERLTAGGNFAPIAQ